MIRTIAQPQARAPSQTAQPSAGISPPNPAGAPGDLIGAETRKDCANAWVSEGALRLRVPVDVLAHAARVRAHLDGEFAGPPAVAIVDESAFAEAVARALNYEDHEDGSTLLTRAFDAAFVRLAHDGDDALDWSRVDDERASREGDEKTSACGADWRASRVGKDPRAEQRITPAAPAPEDAQNGPDAARYRAFFRAGLPVTFLGVEYHDKRSLDAAIDAIDTQEKEETMGGRDKFQCAARGCVGCAVCSTPETPADERAAMAARVGLRGKHQGEPDGQG